MFSRSNAYQQVLVFELQAARARRLTVTSVEASPTAKLMQLPECWRSKTLPSS